MNFIIINRLFFLYAIFVLSIVPTKIFAAEEKIVWKNIEWDFTEQGCFLSGSPTKCIGVNSHLATCYIESGWLRFVEQARYYASYPSNPETALAFCKAEAKRYKLPDSCFSNWVEIYAPWRTQLTENCAHNPPPGYKVVWYKFYKYAQYRSWTYKDNDNNLGPPMCPISY